MSEQPGRIICLLPARNAEADLDGFFASVSRFVDAVVALDDGSTDGTYDRLAREPLVKILLRNPRREDYQGWDDAANRNRLLEAADALDPEWIISLDADERIDEADARSLRHFLATDALPGCAYGMRHVPMRRDETTFWPKYQWIYRLFGYEKGQRFPAQRLHFIPIPTSISRALWFQTTLRVQHLGGMTDDRRLLRFSKYLEADPRRRYQEDYSNVLMGPPLHELRQWQPRPVGMPVLLSEATQPDVVAAELDGVVPPVLSAIVIAQNNERTIARTLASIVNQIVPEPFEVILVTSGSDRTAEIARRDFPTVRVVELDRPALPGKARNAGLAIAQGMFVSFPGSHIELPPGSLAARLRAHRRGYAMVTGITQNGNPTRAGWASYFVDQHEGLPGHRWAEISGPPAHCSYARLPLLEVGAFPEDVRTGEDTAANRALVARGYVAVRDPAIAIVHRSPATTLPKLLRHHVRRGQGWGRLVVQDHRQTGRILTRELIAKRLVRHVPERLARVRKNVARADVSLRPAYEDVRSWVVLAAVSSWLGMWWEILRPTPGKLVLLRERPIRVLVLIESERVRLAMVDLVSGEVETRELPWDLPLPVERELVPLHVIVTAPRPIAAIRRQLEASLHVEGIDVVTRDPDGCVETTLPGWIWRRVERLIGSRGL